MPRVQEFKKITKHFFPSRELYIAAMERGEIKEGDEVFIEGSSDVATPDGSLKIDETLKMTSDGVLGVNTTTKAIKDNTLPITSGGVDVILGNIRVLLETI